MYRFSAFDALLSRSRSSRACGACAGTPASRPIRLALIKGEVTRAGFLARNLFVPVFVANEAHVVDAIFLREDVDLRAGESALFTVNGFKVNIGILGQFRLVACLVRDGE